MTFRIVYVRCSVELGEDLFAAAVREVGEETGLKRDGELMVSTADSSCALRCHVMRREGSSLIK
jgi:8-oxo-dGTP pyrophosphatase MutT (NUDIX family)